MPAWWRWRWRRRWRAERDAETAAWVQARLRDEAWWTGRWAMDGESIESILVRWDPVVWVFFVSSLTASGVRGEEVAWPDRDGLRGFLERIQEGGFAPSADSGTRVVMARLGMGGCR